MPLSEPGAASLVVGAIHRLGRMGYVIINSVERGGITKKCEQVATPAPKLWTALRLRWCAHLGQRPGPLSLQDVTINPVEGGGTTRRGRGDYKARTSWTVPMSSVDASANHPFECEEKEEMLREA